jgi:hypothetical protein
MWNVSMAVGAFEQRNLLVLEHIDGSVQHGPEHKYDYYNPWISMLGITKYLQQFPKILLGLCLRNHKK